jgi:nitrous oxide reductase
MQAHKKTHMSRIARRWPAVVARSTPIAAAAAVLAAGLGLSAPAWSQATLQDVMKPRPEQQDLLAAAKTYVPTGKRDEFVAFSSGGQSGQVIVYGVPSMRILKYIGVFTPEPWQGYGFDESSKAVLRRAASTARTSPGATRTTRRSPKPTASTTASSCSSTTRPTRAWR